MPNGERAVVEIEKLRRYCLDPIHPRGRHKGRVFQSALDISALEADFLRTVLLEAAVGDAASVGQSDRYGTRYTLDLQVEHGRKAATVRSHWIVRRNEDFPRLVTCYVV